MIGHSFDGKAIALTAPSGGECTVALGAIRPFEGSAPQSAIYIKITDKEGGKVAEFGLLVETFGTLIEAIKAAFDAAAEDTPTMTLPPEQSEALLAEGRPHIFLDCDGVLADFDTYAEAYFGMAPRAYEAKVGSKQFWAELEAKGDFYRNMPVMPDAHALVDGVRHLSPTILTGCPRGNWAEQQKVDWAHEHFPGIPIITCRSADKRAHAKPGDVLIDDWHQHRSRWIEMGGVWISHTCAETSLAALWAHYPELRSLAPQPGGEK